MKLAAQKNSWEAVISLLTQGADIGELSGEQCQLLKEQVTTVEYSNKPQLLRQIESCLSTLQIQRLLEFRGQAEAIGLEAVKNKGVTNCIQHPHHVKRRDPTPCTKEEMLDRHLISYDPLEESIAVDQRQAASLYYQLALTIAWQQNKPLDQLLRYQRYLGDIVGEGVNNQSPREKQLIEGHYQQAQHFFQKHPKMTLLKATADGFEPLAGYSVFLESNQHSLLVFNEGQRYQLYSSDFNYKHCFHTKYGISWSEMTVFIKAFFQWKTGSHNYHSLVLKQELSMEALAMLQDSPFWQPDNLAPDKVLLEDQRLR